MGSYRSDCWAALKLGIPQVLPPPTVTAAASSALLHAPCSPPTSSSSSFSRSSSLGCGQTQRVSGNPDSPQLLSPPCPVRGPHKLCSGDAWPGHCAVWGGQMIPSIRGPPLTLHHPNMLCPCPPSLFLPPAQDFCPTSSNTGPWAHKQKRQQWSPARPRVLSFPVRRSQISAPNGAEGPFQQPLVRCGADLPASVSGTVLHRVFYHNPMRPYASGAGSIRHRKAGLISGLGWCPGPNTEPQT